MTGRNSAADFDASRRGTTNTMDTNRIRNLTSNLFSKKVRILGRSIPIATVALAVAVVGAAAWAVIFLLASRFAVSTTVAYSAPTASGTWTCELVSGTGAVIDTCGALAGSGPELVVSGLSEDNLQVRLTRNFDNPNPVAYSYELQGAQNPVLPVCVTDGGANCVPSASIPAASSDLVRIKVLSAGIGPNASLDLTGLEIRWYPTP